ncbi:helix-turn-helix transcriptional regulator [Brachybacterium sp. GPGPB12]|uniref:helix-turn-helix transcriptional regulator n=1 Tax=Brachybacterium sp. GPGPB12 TaxID=3023517 RepID=UPI0031342DEC
MTPLTTPLPEAALASVVELARDRAPSLQVADLADAAGYSPFHFSRLFSARLGIGPGQYLIALRVGRAKEPLLADDAAVIDVACEVGFDSLSSFGRRFRKHRRRHPGALRRLAQTVADAPPRPFTMRVRILWAPGQCGRCWSSPRARTGAAIPRSGWAGTRGLRRSACRPRACSSRASTTSTSPCARAPRSCSPSRCRRTPIRWTCSHRGRRWSRRTLRR